MVYVPCPVATQGLPASRAASTAMRLWGKSLIACTRSTCRAARKVRHVDRSRETTKRAGDIEEVVRRQGHVDLPVAGDLRRSRAVLAREEHLHLEPGALALQGLDEPDGVPAHAIELGEESVRKRTFTRAAP